MRRFNFTDHFSLINGAFWFTKGYEIHRETAGRESLVEKGEVGGGGWICVGNDGRIGWKTRKWGGY
jgi:hypothetical protein